MKHLREFPVLQAQKMWYYAQYLQSHPEIQALDWKFCDFNFWVNYPFKILPTPAAQNFL